MKKTVELILKILSKAILAKYKPKIVGITGSVGKTSTKEAVYAVLKPKFNVRRNIKNYNNEIGLPLTVIGLESAGKSVFGWLAVFLKAVKLILIKDEKYPNILILEMGVDKPGDMKYLNSIVKCDVGILTVIGSVHVENFSTIDNLRKEKAELIKSVKDSGCSILNYDDTRIRRIKDISRAKILTYGLDQKAGLKASGISINFEKESNKKIGINYKLNYQNFSENILLPNALGTGNVYSSLAAAAAGIYFKISLKDIARALLGYKTPKGRMNVIEGIKHTLIIDDSYNAEPKSTAAAFGTLKIMPLIPGKRKFAVLGDMLELGRYSEAEHKNIGRYASKCGIDKLIVVGERARDIARGAEDAGMKRDDIFNFDDSESAGKFLEDRIREGDMILVKGSQGMRMEKIVKEIMAEPLRAEELLVRQDKSWQRK